MNGVLIVNNFYKNDKIIVDNNGDNFFISTINKNSFNFDKVQYEIINQNNISDIEIINNISDIEINYLKKKYNFLNFKGFAKITKIIEENNKVFGILNFKSKIQFGKNNKNKWLIEFKSMNNIYPNCIVSCNNRYSENKYCWININRKKYDEKNYFGNCLEILGNTNDINLSYESCLYQFNSKHKKIKNLEIKNIDFKQLKKLDDNRLDFTCKNIFSIDSENTKDIDDAIHFIIDDDIIELGIHIAEPSYFVERNSNLWNNAKNNISSFYFPHKRSDMIDKSIAENYCSLNENEYRFAYSTVIKINKSSNKILSINYTKSLIKNIKKLSYKNVNLFLKTNKSKFIKHDEIEKDLINLKNNIKYLSDILLNSNKNIDSYNSNKIIEELMIINNNLIAKYLYENNKDSVLKIHRNNINEKIINKSDNEKVNDILKFIKMEKGYYKKSSKIKNNELMHFGLNLKYYTHFTSPIRRIVDLWNQLIIKNSNQFTLTNFDIFYINYMNFIHKNAYKDIELAEIFINYNSNKNEYNGIIIEINYNQIVVFIEELNKLIRIKLVDNKLIDIINIKFDNKSIELNKNELNNDIEKYKLNIFQNIQVKVNINSNKIKWKDKLFFQIINPSLSEWLLI